MQPKSSQLNPYLQQKKYYNQNALELEDEDCSSGSCSVVQHSRPAATLTPLQKLATYFGYQDALLLGTDNESKFTTTLNNGESGGNDPDEVIHLLKNINSLPLGDQRIAAVKVLKDYIKAIRPVDNNNHYPQENNNNNMNANIEPEKIGGCLVM